MKKPASLRAALAALMPEYARDTDRLAMWVEKGHVRSRLGSHGFAWEYELTILLKEFAGDPAVPFFVITEWLRLNQPEALAPGDRNGFVFEADILDDKTWDIQVVLELDDLVVATPAGNGSWNLEARDAIVPIDPDAEPLRDNQGPVLAIWHGGQQLAPPVDD